MHVACDALHLYLCVSWHALRASKRSFAPSIVHVCLEQLTSLLLEALRLLHQPGWSEREYQHLQLQYHNCNKLICRHSSTLFIGCIHVPAHCHIHIHSQDLYIGHGNMTHTLQTNLIVITSYLVKPETDREVRHGGHHHVCNDDVRCRNVGR